MSDHDMVIDINAMLHNAQPPLSVADCCIYKVPFVIRRLNDDAYTPKIISIGPFHHHHPRLKNMEPHKFIYLKAFLQRAETTLHPLIDYIESIIPNFRRCYSETLYFTDQELVKLILIDSAFIIELFWRYYHKQNDAYLLKPCLAYNITVDLFLLENQLPIFVVQKIFIISFGAKTNIPSFLDLTFGYFNDFNKLNLDSKNSDISISHFTDLIRIFHLQHPLGSRACRILKTMKYLPSVTELSEAGVRFKVNTKNKCLLDLRFLGGVLEIPQFNVEDMTEILLRNMIALEQCHYPEESYITSYVEVLDFLINTGRDVDILVKKGILVNWLGDSDSAANLFNSLCKNVTLANCSSDYYVLCENLNGFCSDPLHKLKATLRRDYCGSPWQTAASVAGVLLLILSLLQSVCSVLQVVKQ